MKKSITCIVVHESSDDSNEPSWSINDLVETLKKRNIEFIEPRDNGYPTLIIKGEGC